MKIDEGRRRTSAPGSRRAPRRPRPSPARARPSFPGRPPGPGVRPSRPVVALARREGLVGAGRRDRPGASSTTAWARRSRGRPARPTPVAAMRRLFRPTDVVGIKVNCLGGRGVSTRPEVALQLAALLQAAGVPADRIYIWDRTDRELREAGFAGRARPGRARPRHQRGLRRDGSWSGGPPPRASPASWSRT